MGRKQGNLPVAALESCDQETQTQQGKCEAYVLGCLLKSILTLLHKHAYTHTNTNTNTHTLITDTERLQTPYNNKFVTEFLSVL